MDPSELEKMSHEMYTEKSGRCSTPSFVRMLVAHQCYGAAIADGTHTMLMMRDSKIEDHNNLVVNAMKTGIDVKESALRFEPREDFEEICKRLSNCGH